MKLAHPEWIVSTDWLETHLDDPELTILESTVHLDRSLDEKDGARQDHEAAHVPGAVFLDATDDLSEPDDPVPFTRLVPDALAAAFAKAGVSDASERSRVVVYSAGHMMWATRVLWLLHGIGFDRVAVLDGGFPKWKQEGRPLESGVSSPEPGALTARPRPELWADRAEVEAAIGDGGVCTLNALPRALFTGEAERHYGRPGRIAGSYNVPFSAVVDGASGVLQGAQRLARRVRGHRGIRAGTCDHVLRRRHLGHCGCLCPGPARSPPGRRLRWLAAGMVRRC